MLRRTGNLPARPRREQGASAVEYGLLVALIAAVIVVAVLLVGGVVRGAFQDTKTSVCDGTEKASTSSDCGTSG
jgi:pilus assembly protein Flp/PilA